MDKSDYAYFEELNQRLQQADRLRQEGQIEPAVKVYQQVIASVDSARRTERRQGTRVVSSGERRWVEPAGGYANREEGMGAAGISSHVSGSAGHWEAITRVETYTISAEVELQAGDPARRLAARALLGWGSCLYLQSRHREAAEKYQQAIQPMESFGESPELARLHWFIGACKEDGGDWEDAIRWFGQAERLFARCDDARLANRMRSLQGQVFLRLRNFPAAGEILEQCREEARKLGDRERLADVTSHLATAADWMRQSERALALRQESLGIYQELDRPFEAAILLNDIADGYLRQGLVNEAEEHITAACSMAERTQGDQHRRVSMLIQQTRAEICLVQERYREVLQFAAEAREVARVLRDPVVLADLAYLTGRALSRMGTSQAAQPWLEQAIQSIEAFRSQMRVEKLRAGLLGARTGPYGEMVQLLADRDPTQALRYAERAKARTFLDTMGASADRRNQARAPKAVEELERLRRRISAIHAQMTHGLDGPGAAVTVRDIVSVKVENPGAPPEGMEEELQKAVRQYEAALARLGTEDPETASFCTVQSIEPADACQMLPPGSVVLEFFAHEETLYAFVIGRQGIRCFRVREPVAVLERQTTQLRAALEAEEALSLLQPQLRGLGRSLLSPVQAELTNAAHLIVIPHGKLHLLPFHALLIKDSYLAEHCAVSYAPSLSVLHFCLAKPVKEAHWLVAIGNPDGSLPASETEVEKIGERFPHAYTRKGGGATRRWLQNLAPHGHVLHLACHAHFSPTAPMFSFLQMARSGDDSGELSADEILREFSSPSLVTLSACQTGVAEVELGDEMMGLTRAFFHAGASSVVSSLWCVDDPATAQFMQVFYERLMTHDRVQALHHAQLALLRRRDTSHPRLWAAFILTGSWQHRASSFPKIPRQPFDLLPPFVTARDIDPCSQVALPKLVILDMDPALTVTDLITSHPNHLAAAFDRQQGLIQLLLPGKQIVPGMRLAGRITAITSRGPLSIPYEIDFRPVARLALSMPNRVSARRNRIRYAVNLSSIGSMPSDVVGVSLQAAASHGASVASSPEWPVSIEVGQEISLEVEFDYNLAGPADRKAVLAINLRGASPLEQEISAFHHPLPAALPVIGNLALGAVSLTCLAVASQKLLFWLLPFVDAWQERGVGWMLLSILLGSGLALAAGFQACWLTSFLEGAEGPLRKQLAFAWGHGIGAALLTMVVALVFLIVGAILHGALGGLFGLDTSGLLDWGLGLVICLCLAIYIGALMAQLNDEMDAGMTGSVCCLVLAFVPGWVLVSKHLGAGHTPAFSFPFWFWFWVLVSPGMGAGFGLLAARSRTVHYRGFDMRRLTFLGILTLAAAAVLLAPGSPTYPPTATVRLARVIPREQRNPPSSDRPSHVRPSPAKTGVARKPIELQQPKQLPKAVIGGEPSFGRDILLTNPFGEGYGRLEWPWKATMDCWRTERGTLVISMKKPGIWAHAVLPASEWSDYAIECNFRHVSSALAFIFRMGGEQGTHYRLVMVRSEQQGSRQSPAQIRLVRYRHTTRKSSGTLSSVEETTLDKSPYNLTRMDFHQMRLEVQGNRMKVFVNGRQILQAEDTAAERPRSGGIGFGAATCWSRPCEAVIKDLRVVKLDAK